MPDIVSLIELASSDMNLRTRVEAIQELANQANESTPEVITFLNRIAKYEMGAELAVYGQAALHHLKKKYPSLQNLEGPIEGERSALQHLNAEQFELRLKAIEYLECEGLTSSVPELIRRLKVEHHPFVISKLTKTLGLLGFEFNHDELFQILAPFLNHKDDRIRANTIQGLGGLQFQEKIPRMIHALMEDSSERVQNMASVVLSLEEATPTLKQIKSYLDSGDEKVFEKAMNALKLIDYPEAHELWESYRQREQKKKVEESFKEAVELEWDEGADEIPDFSEEMDQQLEGGGFPEYQEVIANEGEKLEFTLPGSHPEPPVSSPPPPQSAPTPPEPTEDFTQTLQSLPPLESTPPAPITAFQSSEEPSTQKMDPAPDDQSQVKYAYNPALSEKYQFETVEEGESSEALEEEDEIAPIPDVGRVSEVGKLSQSKGVERVGIGDRFLGFIWYFIRKLIFASLAWGMVLAYFMYEKEIIDFAMIEVESYQQGRGILWAKLPPPKKQPLPEIRKRPVVPKTDDGEEKLPSKKETDSKPVEKKGEPGNLPDQSQATGEPSLQIADSKPLRSDGKPPASLRLVKRKSSTERGALEGFTRHTYSNGDKFIGTYRNGKKNGEGSMFFMNGEVYVGQWAEDLFHGQGTYTWPNGDRFVGTFAKGMRDGKGVFSWTNSQRFEGGYKEGKRSGRGKMLFPNGEVYEGEFLEDRFHGGGTYTFSDGSIYDGLFENGVIQGEGKYIYSNGRIYEGEFQEGKRNGEGRMVFPNGELYEGAWQSDEYHGKGYYRWSSGDWYRGDWVKGRMEGSGIYHWVNGDEYSGEFQGDKPNGKGVLKYFDMGRYEGTFVEGLRDGEGTYFSPEGYSYAGTWKNGKQHGLGATRWPDGEGYHGQWKYGVEHGMGRYSWSAGAKYIGQWRDGAKNGLGTFVTSDGQVREGLWKDDTFVGSIPENIQEWKKELQFMKFFFERSTENKRQPAGS